MLKQTILSRAAENENQKRNSLKVTPNENQRLDVDLEAALLSLDHSQITQNMMKEFMNAKNDGLIPNITA